MLSKAKIGDRVWSLLYGWGTIISVDVHDKNYPIEVDYDIGGCDWITSCGRHMSQDLNPTWFWDEVVITPPERPLPELAVDTPVLVSNRMWDSWQKRHFHSFTDGGTIQVWDGGATSFTAIGVQAYSEWKYWKLPEESERESRK